MKQLFIAMRVFIVLTILTGFLYTFAITAIARIIFPNAAGGSLIVTDGHVRGSRLIAQEFSGAGYFQARPSAISYNPLPSGGSNLSVISHDLKKSMDDRRAAFDSANGLTSDVSVPPDMLFTSGSGLDPHTSPEAARLQINRIAGQRHMTSLQKEALAAMVERSIEQPQFGFLGMPRVNVLMLNCMLDNVKHY
jgi:K+-transporting ATPase ATPase C chain